MDHFFGLTILGLLGKSSIIFSRLLVAANPSLCFKNEVVNFGFAFQSPKKVLKMIAGKAFIDSKAKKHTKKPTPRNHFTERRTVAPWASSGRRPSSH